MYWSCPQDRIGARVVCWFARARVGVCVAISGCYVTVTLGWHDGASVTERIGRCIYMFVFNVGPGCIAGLQRRIR